MKRLVVNSDDFGMCRAVNAGVVGAFREGVLTSASVMACAPWFNDAAALAVEHGLPIGIHLTATCEWDRYRWRPITPARSFTESDGTLPRTVEAVRRRAVRSELESEFRAQIERVLAARLRPTHLDSHMDVIFPDLLAKLARDYDIPTHNVEAAGAGTPAFVMASRECFSATAGDRVERFCEYLRTRSDGDHLVVVHAAEDGGELRAMASPDSPVRPWARDYRVADLAMILDARARRAWEDSGVRLISFADLPRVVSGPGAE